MNATPPDSAPSAPAVLPDPALNRNDFRTIVELVDPGVRVLDLGCGDGTLLKLLQKHKGALGYGVEHDPNRIMDCIEKGLSVFQGNLDEGLRDFEDQSFDYVILNLTLPEVHKPDFVLNEMLRVGKKAVVCFPNFAQWHIRLRLLFLGRMPVDPIIPHQWFDTPNIHHLTVCDFEEFCGRRNLVIHRRGFFRTLAGGRVQESMLFPNWSASFALYVLGHNA